MKQHSCCWILTILLYAIQSGLALSQSFRAITEQSLPNAIARPQAYDLQPSVLFDTEDPNPAGRYKMWWLGQDPASPSGVPGDRIYFSRSMDGNTWEQPRAVLAPQLGANGINAADDHLLGSPSVLKIQGKFYMFYEAYGTYATVVNRFYHAARGDNWTCHGFPQETGDWLNGYDADRRVHGFALRYAKARTHPVYAGEITYNRPSGIKYNRFLRRTPVVAGNGVRVLNHGEPIFWLYDEPAPGRQPLFSFWGSLHWNTFTSTDPGAEGVPGAVPDYSISPLQNTHVLGYLAESLETADMLGCLQNRIMLATSTDGMKWTRFSGAAGDGAILAPINSRTSQRGFSNPYRCANEVWDIHRAYGSGFPSVLTRDEWLEVYMTDDTADDGWLNRCGGFSQCRIRLPLSQIENASAYLSAGAQRQFTDSDGFGAFYGEDIKWSPHFQRYFVTTFDPNGRLLLVWSNPLPNPALPPSFPRDPAQNFVILPENIHAVTPPGGRLAGPAGIASSGLGQTLDFDQGTDATAPYTAFHLLYESSQPGDLTPFGKDLGHGLVFVWDQIPTIDPPLSNQPPSVSAGRDRTLIVATLPTRLIMEGRVVDDGKPISPGRVTATWIQRSGPGAAQFDSAAVPATGVSLPATGQYVFRLTASDGELTATQDVVIVVALPNTVPRVAAGPDIRVIWTGGIAQTILRGTVLDDGLPALPARLATLWKKRSGPGLVTFASPQNPVTAAQFSLPGQYVLDLEAFDGDLRSSDNLVVEVAALPMNQAPVVTAGPDQSLRINPSALLAGRVTDDGLPSNGRTMTTWMKVSGPNLTFANVNNPTTSVTLSETGTYVLRLTANDGEKTSTDDVVLRFVANEAPRVNAGPDRSIVFVADQSHDFVLQGSVWDDGLPTSTVTLQWSLVSGPGVVRFRNPASVISKVWFSQTGRYELKLLASDGLKSSSDTVVISYNAPVGSNVIEGTVMSSGGNRVQVAGGARMSALVDGVIVATTVADTQGRYTFRVGAGRYSVRSSWNSYSGELPNCALFLTPGPNAPARACNVTVR